MDPLTKDMEDEFRRCFDMFDKDHSGYICKSELKTVLQAWKQYPTEEEVQNMIKELDKNENGKIEYDEFLEYMRFHFKSEETSATQMRDAFKVFDKDGNGKIDAKELREAMKNLGDKLTDKEVDEMIKAADLDSDGKVDYNEFVRVMMQ